LSSSEPASSSGDERRRGAHPGDLLDDDHGGQRVRADPAVLLGDVRGVEVGRPQRVVGRLRELARIVDGGGVGGHLARTDIAYGGPDELVLLRYLVHPVDVVGHAPPHSLTVVRVTEG
jgi:hypothetical protein